MIAAVSPTERQVTGVDPVDVSKGDSQQNYTAQKSDSLPPTCLYHPAMLRRSASLVLCCFDEGRFSSKCSLRRAKVTLHGRRGISYSPRSL